MELIFYKQPFKLDEYSGWVYDTNNNFVFQFELDNTDKLNHQIMDIINDKENSKTSLFSASKEEQEIYVVTLDNNKHHCITIRGWGNLTGTGAHNLSIDRAIEIQDSFIDWLLFKLNR